MSFILRLSIYHYPNIHTSRWGDGSRDYLVASYIKNYKEFPKVGPFNLLYESGIRGSPLYYYLLALMLLLNDNIHTLAFVNIFLQVITILTLYAICKIVFGNPQAIIAATLFSFTPEILRQSEYIWQPHLMQPLSYTALLILILAHFKKNIMLLFGANVLLSFAFVIHNSALPWLPIFFLASLKLIKNFDKKLKFYIGLFLSFITPIVISYLPTLYYYLDSNQSIRFVVGSNYFADSFQNFIANLKFNLNQILSTFGLKPIFFIIIFLGSISLFRRSYGRYLIFLSVLFLAPILLSSLFNKNQLHYLTLSFGIFSILSARFVTLPFLIPLKLPDKIIRWGLIFIIAVVLFKAFSGEFKFLYWKEPERFNWEYIPAAASAIQNEISNEPDSFQIVSFAHNGVIFRYPTLDTILIVPLEKSLNVKLAKISDDDPYNLVQINSKEYLFLSCFEFLNQIKNQDCRGEFQKLYPNYSIIKPIYNQYPLLIFLTRRNTP